MKRLMTFLLVALLSLGVVSVSLAQEGAGGQAGGEAPTPAKKTTKKHVKKHRKGKRKAAPSQPEEMK